MTLHVVVAFTAVLLAERLVEMVVSWVHTDRLRARGGRIVRDDGFGLLLVVHVGLFVGVLTEAAVAPYAGAGWWTLPALVLVGAAMALRWWVVRTLGDRWTLRVVVVPGAPPVTGGPYRWVRHPNYLAVVVELVAFPLAFGCIATAVLVSLVNAWALHRRIRVEERALEEAGGYEDAFAGRGRLTP